MRITKNTHWWVQNTENVVFKQIENIENTEINNHTERFSYVKCSNNFCK